MGQKVGYKKKQQLDHPRTTSQIQSEHSIDISPIIQLVNDIHKSIESMEEHISKKVTDQVIKSLSDNVFSMVSEMGMS